VKNKRGNKQMHDEKMQEFAIELTDKCPTHQDWVLTVRFGMVTLLADPELLVEILLKEADRIVKQRPEHFNQLSAFVTICEELKLRFECASE
jgi:hypothetical protein